MSTRSRRGLSHTAVVGLKRAAEQCRWAVSKAFQPVADSTANVTSKSWRERRRTCLSAAESATVGARRTASRAVESISGNSHGNGESVSDLMGRAEHAADRAQEKESRALALAQKAKDDATIARQTTDAASASSSKRDARPKRVLPPALSVLDKRRMRLSPRSSVSRMSE